MKKLHNAFVVEMQVDDSSGAFEDAKQKKNDAIGRMQRSKLRTASPVVVVVSSFFSEYDLEPIFTLFSLQVSLYFFKNSGLEERRAVVTLSRSASS